MFKDFKREGHLSEKQLNYYGFKYKKTCNLGKLYLQPKIHKKLYNVPVRPVISNCGTNTEKTSEFLENYLKSIMQISWSSSRDLGDFIDKTNRIKNIPKDAILVNRDMMGLHPCIAHVAGLKAVKNPLDVRENKSIQTEKRVCSQHNVSEFTGIVKEQMSGNAIETKCAPTYPSIFF